MITHSRTPWNKDRFVGPRTKFDPIDVCAITEILRQNGQHHDLCLFSVGIDSMLRCSDLLKLKVSDVSDRYGVVCDRFVFGQQKTNHGVAPALTKTSREACQRWIEISEKKRADFLFTRAKLVDSPAIHENTYRNLVKQWAELLRLDPTNYSTHSLRRSKPHFMFRTGVEIEYISELLGHKDTSTTYRYLGITQEEAQEFALQHDIFKKSQHRKHRSVRKLSNRELPDIFTANFQELRRQLLSLQNSVCSMEQNIAELLEENRQQSDLLHKIHTKLEKRSQS